MEVVGRGGAAELTDALQRQGADVVILGEGIGRYVEARQLLLTHPHLKIVTIAREGRLASVFEIRQMTLIEPSPQMLIQAVRSTQRSARLTTVIDSNK
jgi:hypothetical protein